MSMCMLVHHPALYFLYTTQSSIQSLLCVLAWAPSQSLMLKWTYIQSLWETVFWSLGPELCTLELRPQWETDLLCDSPHRVKAKGRACA